MKTFKEFMSEQGVVTPKDFTPFNLRGVPHIRTPEIKNQEMLHFRKFIQNSGGKWQVKRKNNQNPKTT